MEQAGARQYLWIWAALLALTAVEVVVAYLQTPSALMLALLIGLSTLKAALIIGWFMHLRWERRALFYFLFPALLFCIALLFGLLPDAGGRL
jgi:caa(3)-type oxidase subunit IV